MSDVYLNWTSEMLEEQVRRILPLIVVVWALPTLGQTQTMCRDLKESGGFVYQGETVINGQACRQVSYAPAQQSVVATASAPVADTKPAPAVTAPSQPAVAPASMAPAPAASVKDKPPLSYSQGTLLGFQTVSIGSTSTITHHSFSIGDKTFDQPDTISTDDYHVRFYRLKIGDVVYSVRGKKCLTKYAVGETLSARVVEKEKAIYVLGKDGKSTKCKIVEESLGK